MSKYNLRILVIAVLISCIGILSIYSSNYRKEGQLLQDIYKRQIFWVALGLFLFFLVSNLNYRRLWDWTYFLYAFALLLLILVFGLGIIRLGAQRWLRFGWLNFQPSELAKLALVIYLARYFSKSSEEDISSGAHNLGIVRALFIPFAFIAVPAAFIVEQPDLGSAILVMLIFIAMLYLTGIKLRYIALLILAGCLLVPVLWSLLKDYQRDRILVFLNPNIDPLGAGYTVIQSKIAIGSGALFGKGWLSGTQSQLRFLPESHTDFIFATFAEEWGFFGSTVLIFLYYLLIRYGFSIAQGTSERFGKLLATGISVMLGIQICINIAMNMGLAPIVGIPLPLMSYGGSSVFITYIALGILVNINKTRTVF